LTPSLRLALTGLIALLALAACGGTAAPAAASPSPAASSPATSPSPPAVLVLAATLEGKYTGSWKNTTFGSTGPLTIDWKFDKAASTLTATVTVGGNVFGAPAPPAQTWAFKPDGQKLTYTGKSPAFGEVTANIEGGPTTGTFTFKGANVPSSNASLVEATGSLSAKEMTGTYTVGLSSGAKAAGTVSATR
jgi:hypothetical protein